MTGYGRGENFGDNRRFTIEMKSVNHRFADISIKMPKSMNIFEERIRKYLTDEISRGKVDVYITFESFSKNDIAITLNTALADLYVDEMRKLKDIYTLADDVNLSILTRYTDIFSVEKTMENESLIWDLLSPALESALNQFISMREKEGLACKNDIIIKLNKIEKESLKINELAPLVPENYRQKLKTRISELLQDVDLDETRIATEVAYFSDKCCIDEELTRLKSHIEQMRGFLEQKEPVGKKLDFLVQEMNREVNTIASKANDLTITKITVELKNEIEKIKEQVQNIE